MRPCYPPRPLTALQRKQQLRKVASFELARLRELEEDGDEPTAVVEFESINEVQQVHRRPPRLAVLDLLFERFGDTRRDQVLDRPPGTQAGPAQRLVEPDRRSPVAGRPIG